MANESMCDGKFYQYFKENMGAMGIPVTDHVFTDVFLVKGFVDLLEKAITTMGSRVTVLELVKAGVLSEAWITIGGVGAAYLLGVVVGSLFVASFRCATGGKNIYDLISFAQREGIKVTPEMENIWREYPGIWNQEISNRVHYAGLMAFDSASRTVSASCEKIG